MDDFVKAANKRTHGGARQWPEALKQEAVDACLATARASSMLVGAKACIVRVHPAILAARGAEVVAVEYG